MDDGDVSEKERQETIARMIAEVEAELAAPPPEPPPPPDARALNDVFGSDTHVRVIRVLALLGRHLNLSARDIARRAGVSHVRVLQVVRQLERAGVLEGHHAATHAIYELDPEREAELTRPAGGSSPPRGSGRRT